MSNWLEKLGFAWNLDSRQQLSSWCLVGPWGWGWGGSGTGPLVFVLSPPSASLFLSVLFFLPSFLSSSSFFFFLVFIWLPWVLAAAHEI